MRQVVIGILGILLASMSLSLNFKYRRFAPLVGLVVQPFWFVETWRTGQWGMFLVCIPYTLIYAYDAWRIWIKRRSF